jgi:hypothetical protein
MRPGSIIGAHKARPYAPLRDHSRRWLMSLRSVRGQPPRPHRCQSSPVLFFSDVATSVSEWKRLHLPIRQAQGPEPVEGLTLVATAQPSRSEPSLSLAPPPKTGRLSLAKYSDDGCRHCRSGFMPDIPGKPVGDKPRPTVGSRHPLTRDSVIGIFTVWYLRSSAKSAVKNFPWFPCAFSFAFIRAHSRSPLPGPISAFSFSVFQLFSFPNSLPFPLFVFFVPATA